MNHYPATKNSPAKIGHFCKFSQENKKLEKDKILKKCNDWSLRCLGGSFKHR